MRISRCKNGLTSVTSFMGAHLIPAAQRVGFAMSHKFRDGATPRMVGALSQRDKIRLVPGFIGLTQKASQHVTYDAQTPIGPVLRRSPRRLSGRPAATLSAIENGSPRERKE